MAVASLVLDWLTKYSQVVSSVVARELRIQIPGTGASVPSLNTLPLRVRTSLSLTNVIAILLVRIAGESKSHVQIIAK